MESDGKGGVVELPLARGPTDPPPCDVCPKIPAGRPKVWTEAAEFDDWFFDAVDWFEECRAIGDFGDPDPVMRRVARLLAEDRERAARERQSAEAADQVRRAFGRR